MKNKSIFSSLGYIFNAYEMHARTQARTSTSGGTNWVSCNDSLTPCHHLMEVWFATQLLLFISFYSISCIFVACVYTYIVNRALNEHTHTHTHIYIYTWGWVKK